MTVAGLILSPTMSDSATDTSTAAPNEIPSALDSTLSSTRITQCGVLPLQCAGVEVSNKLNATCTVVKVKAHDRARLLFDLATFFQRNKHNVVEADVTTSPSDSMASDIFLIQQSDRGKISKPRRLAEDIRDVVLNTDEQFEQDGVSPKPSPVKPPRDTVDGDDANIVGQKGDAELNDSQPKPDQNARPAVLTSQGAEKSGEAFQVVLKTKAVANPATGTGSNQDSTPSVLNTHSAEKTGLDKTAHLAAGDGVKLSNVLHAGSDFTNATEISMEVPDRVGLLADVCHCLVRNNVSVLNAHIYTTADGTASNYFSVRDAQTNGRVRDEILEEMRQALAARCHRESSDRGKGKGLRFEGEDVTSAEGTPTRHSDSIPSDGASPTFEEQRAGFRRFQPSMDGDPRGTQGNGQNSSNSTKLVSKYGMANARAPGAGMVRAHGGEVLEHAWTHQQKLLANKNVKHADLNSMPSIDLGSVDDNTRHVVEMALNTLPAYASLTFPSAKSEIFHELREVNWAPGEVAFEKGSPVPNLYVILEGALHRESYFSNQKASQMPGNILSRGSLYGEAALQHSYATKARVISENGEREGVHTRAFAVSGETFKRIVRARVHRARRLLANVLNVVATFQPAPADSKELLLNALWSGSATRRKGEPFAGAGFEKKQKTSQHSQRSMHVILEGEVRRVTSDGTETVLKAGESFGEDWLLSDTVRAEMALDENAAGRALRREASTTYFASDKFQPVTLEITRGTLRTLWGVEFDSYLRSRHDVAQEGAAAQTLVDVPGRGSLEKRLSSDSRRASLPDMNEAQGAVHSPGGPQIPPTPLVGKVGGRSSSSIVTSDSVTSTNLTPPKRSIFKILSKKMKRALGVPSKAEKAERVKKKQVTSDTTSDTRESQSAMTTPQKASDTNAEPHRSRTSSSDSQTTVAEVHHDDDVLGELPKSFTKHVVSAVGEMQEASPRPLSKMTRIGTMLDIRDARDAGEGDSNPAVTTVTTKLGLGGFASPGDSFSPASKPSSKMRNAHSVMDISAMSREAESDAHPRLSEVKETHADASAVDSSTTSSQETSRTSQTSSTTAYQATASAMGMSGEEYAEQSRMSKQFTPDIDSQKTKEPSPLDNYVFAKQLGVGLTGSVYKAWRRDSTEDSSDVSSNTPYGSILNRNTPRYLPVAVKVMDKVKILDINETAHVVRESKIMKSVSRHPFIVSMVESFQTKSAMFIVMEYATGKDLFHMIHEHGALRVSQCKAFVVQTVLALDHVHAKGFVYRDLKPENLLVLEDGYLRLTDFGFAKALRPGERAYTVCGTPDYLAPETLRQQGCTRAADFWAVGVLLFEMLTGYPPFHGQTHSELYRRITSGRMRAFPRNFDEDAADLVNKLLRQSEGERIGVGADGIQRIRRHSFFKGFSWTAVLEQRAVMHKPVVAKDSDSGPQDVSTPVVPECLKRPCGLTDEEQKLFVDF